LTGLAPHLQFGTFRRQLNAAFDEMAESFFGNGQAPPYLIQLPATVTSDLLLFVHSAPQLCLTGPQRIYVFVNRAQPFAAQCGGTLIDFRPLPCFVEPVDPAMPLVAVPCM